VRDLDDPAVVELGRARRTGAQVDEEVALQEDARTDLGRGVLVQRQALLGDWSVTTDVSLPAFGSTFATLPTLTPAIRTGEPGRIELADSKVALTWKGVVKGMSFVKPR
jgi:hypothetical protein